MLPCCVLVRAGGRRLAAGGVARFPYVGHRTRTRYRQFIKAYTVVGLSSKSKLDAKAKVVNAEQLASSDPHKGGSRRHQTKVHSASVSESDLQCHDLPSRRVAGCRLHPPGVLLLGARTSESDGDAAHHVHGFHARFGNNILYCNVSSVCESAVSSQVPLTDGTSRSRYRLRRACGWGCRAVARLRLGATCQPPSPRSALAVAGLGNTYGFIPVRPPRAGHPSSEQRGSLSIIHRALPSAVQLS